MGKKEFLKVKLILLYSYFLNEKQYIPKNNEVLLFKKLFMKYNDGIISIFEDLLNEKDSDVITYPDLKEVLRKNVIK